MVRCDGPGLRHPGVFVGLVALGGVAGGVVWARLLREPAGGPRWAALWTLLAAAGAASAGAVLAGGARECDLPAAGRPRRSAGLLLIALVLGVFLLLVACEFHRSVGITGMYKPLRLALDSEVAVLYVTALPLYAAYILWTETRLRRDALRRGTALALAVGGAAAWLMQDLLRLVRD